MTTSLLWNSSASGAIGYKLKKSNNLSSHISTPQGLIFKNNVAYVPPSLQPSTSQIAPKSI